MNTALGASAPLVAFPMFNDTPPKPAATAPETKVAVPDNRPRLTRYPVAFHDSLAAMHDMHGCMQKPDPGPAPTRRL